MLVDIRLIELQIIRAIGLLTEKRKFDKKININSNSISKIINREWHTVNSNLLKLKNIKGL
jgi:hypothetical protein